MTRRSDVRLGGVVVMLAAIPLFFAWGVFFNLFGHPIHWTWQTVGFFGWIALGIAALGYVRSGVAGGLRYCGVFVSVAGGAALLGLALGHYR
jgi:hypothetical protein